MSDFSSTSLTVASASVHAGFWPTDEASFSRYTLGQLLFSTNLGEVRRVSLSSGGGPDMIVKISKLPVPGSMVEDPQTEALMLGLLARDAPANLFPTMYDQQIVSRPCGQRWHFMFLQHCGDDLHTIISRHDRLTEQDAHRVFSGLLDAVEALHCLSICHLDLKPENILFDVRDSRVRVCDFGQARHSQYQSGRYGTPGYRAPEQDGAQSYCGFKADMYSLGVVLFFLLSRQNLAAPEWQEVLRDEHWLNQEMMHFQLGADVRDLISGLVRPASIRLRLPQVRSHPWISRE